MNVIWKDVFFNFLLLVVKHNIWPPDVIGWHVKHIYSTVLCRIPSHLVIKPELLYPKIGCHDLISQILKQINNHISHHFMAKSHIPKISNQKLLSNQFQLTTSISWESLSFNLTVTASVTLTTGLTNLL